MEKQEHNSQQQKMHPPPINIWEQIAVPVVQTPPKINMWDQLVTPVVQPVDQRVYVDESVNRGNYKSENVCFAQRMKSDESSESTGSVKSSKESSNEECESSASEQSTKQSSEEISSIDSEFSTSGISELEDEDASVHSLKVRV